MSKLVPPEMLSRVHSRVEISTSLNCPNRGLNRKRQRFPLPENADLFGSSPVSYENAFHNLSALIYLNPWFPQVLPGGSEYVSWRLILRVLKTDACY